MKLPLDADMLLMRACTTPEVQVEACIDAEQDIWSRWADRKKAREIYWEHVDRFVEYYNAERCDVIHCFTQGSTFRKQLCPTYKWNRKSKAKPIGYASLKQELCEMPNAVMHDMVEADDLLGLFATQLKARKENYAVLSGDKDLKQIPGRTMWIDMEEVYNSQESATKQFWLQALKGDRTDGVEGCPGIGEVKAEAIVSKFDLSDEMGCWEKVVEQFGKKGKDENFALQQARLVRILKNGEYNFHTQTVDLWSPTKSCSV